MTHTQPRQPEGQPTGGRWTNREHAVPAVALTARHAGALDLDPQLAVVDSALHDALAASGLDGRADLTAREDVMWTTRDGGTGDRLEFLIESVDGGRYEVTDLRDGDARSATGPEDVPRTIQGLVARARALDVAPFDRDRFQIADVGFWKEPAPGGGDQTHISVDLCEQAAAARGFVSGTSFIDLHYYTGEGRLEIWNDGMLADASEADALAAHVCPERQEGEPEGSARDRLGWHMERLLRRTAARDDVPEWMRADRVDGLTYQG